MNIHIETKRLLLRDIEITDAQGIFELDSDPDVHEFLGNKPISTFEEAQNVISYIRNQYKEHGIGRWAVIDKATGDFIGWSGLKYEKVVRKEFNYYDIGYRIKKKYWGKGIATETALESLKYGFQKLNLEEIGAAAAVNHLVSTKILTKIGLKFIETFDFDGKPHNWYKLSKSEWVENKEIR